MCAGDVEAKLIAERPEAVADLYLRVPEHRQTLSKRKTPAFGPRQVIDGAIIGIEELNSIRTRGVPFEIHGVQAAHVSKRLASDVRNAGRDGDAGQTAGEERPVFDARDAVAYRNISQTCAIFERIGLDGRDGVGNHDTGQAGAGFECAFPDVGDIGANRDVGQAGAVIECFLAETGDAVSRRDAGQFEAIIEDSCTDGSDVGAYDHVRQAPALLERRAPKVGNAVWDRYAGQNHAALECPTSDTGDGIAIGLAGDCHRPARTSVSRDSDRAIVGRESELGLHCGG